MPNNDKLSPANHLISLCQKILNNAKVEYIEANVLDILAFYSCYVNNELQMQEVWNSHKSPLSRSNFHILKAIELN
ncbi:MAG: hypothetical protein V7L23_28660 [Nostoc sp.]|uniref:hypothetical protein n=1 Tax=Nostoc sp. TaxID=1180 RepID=UPI002FF33CD1